MDLCYYITMVTNAFKLNPFPRRAVHQSDKSILSGTCDVTSVAPHPPPPTILNLVGKNRTFCLIASQGTMSSTVRSLSEHIINSRWRLRIIAPN